MGAGVSNLPGIELPQLTGLALQFLFAMLRIGAFVLSAPLFSAKFISLPLRILFTVALSVSLMGQIALPDASRLASLSSMAWVVQELLIGLAAGMVLQILFAAAIMAGDRIANTAGLGLAAQVDPATGTQSPVIGQFIWLFLLVIFITRDGHLAAIRLVLESYRQIPPATPLHMTPLLRTGLDSVEMMYSDSTQLMMPVVSVLLILNIVIGVITRSAPQLNIFAFGFPLTMTATLLLLFLTVSLLGSALSDKVAQALGVLSILFDEARNG